MSYLKKNSALLFFLTSLSCYAQLINNGFVPIKTGGLEFNPEIVKKNHIKSIRINIINKPDGSVMVNKGAVNGYNFNYSGHMTKYYYTVLDKIVPAENNGKEIKQTGLGTNPNQNYINDTIITEIIYDKSNRAITKKTKTDNIIEISEMKYDNQNQMTGETRTRLLYVTSKDGKVTEHKTTILTDKYEYQKLTRFQTKAKVLNSNNYPYKSIIFTRDSLDNIKSYNMEFASGMMYESYYYEYNKAKQISKRTYTTNSKGGIREISIYEYNKKGELSSEKTYVNDQLTYEVGYLFDDKTGLIKSEVSRDHKKQMVVIGKYEYTFY